MAISGRNLPQLARPDRTWDGESPKVQLFVARHRPFLVLVGVMIAQLLLLSFQITRNHKVRLIQVWAVTLFDPFERALHKLSRTTTLAWRDTHKLWRAQEENKALQTELVSARARIQELTEEGAEGQRLRALLEFKNRLALPSVAAEVIAASPGENSNAIYIDKGKDSGLTTDLAVITPDGIVGKVIAVFPYTAQVLLVTDPLSGVGCILQKSRIQGVLKGAGRNLSELHYIMNDAQVSPGEVVLTSGLDKIYPKGLWVGTVAEAGAGSTYKKIVVKPAAKLDQLESVVVLLRPPSSQDEVATLPPRP